MRRLLIALLLLMSFPAPTMAYTIVDTYDANGDGWIDTWGLDDNGDGLIDRLLADFDGNGVAELQALTTPDGQDIQTIYLDTNGTNHYNAVIVVYRTIGSLGAVSLGLSLFLDNDANGLWEVAYYDGHNDGVFEWVLVDTTGNGAADTWQANETPSGQDVASQQARSVAAVSSLQILAAGNVPIWGPSTIPLH